MDYLWSPWRYQYIAKSAVPGCIFCLAPAANNDQEMLIVHRGVHNYVILNRYPYTSGHAMVVPYDHISLLTALPADTLTELIQLTQLTQRHLQALYRPAGMNLGMNQGECAGAGVAGHLHMHLVPRWVGDANFMTITGETRVLPEDLSLTYTRLAEAFQRSAITS